MYAIKALSVHEALPLKLKDMLSLALGSNVTLVSLLRWHWVFSYLKFHMLRQNLTLEQIIVLGTLIACCFKKKKTAFFVTHLLCTGGWPWTTEPPAPTSEVLRIQVCVCHNSHNFLVRSQRAFLEIRFWNYTNLLWSLSRLRILLKRLPLAVIASHLGSTFSDLRICAATY